MPMTIDGDGSITGLSAGGLPNASVVQADLAAGVAGNGPAFSGYMSNGASNFSVTTNTATKVPIDTENFDTNSNFDTSTYRFTPTVAGYYQVNGQVALAATSGITQTAAYIYKNGSAITTTFLSTTNNTRLVTSALVYMNGTTDYLELYGLVAATSSPVFGYFGVNVGCQFSASLVRAV